MATSRPDEDEIATGSGRLTEERSQHQAGSHDRRGIAGILRAARSRRRRGRTHIALGVSRRPQEPSGRFHNKTCATSETNQPAEKIVAIDANTIVRRGNVRRSSSGRVSRSSASASRLQIHHSPLTINPKPETHARCGLVSAVPSAATRKLLGIRKISVIFTKSGCGARSTSTIPPTPGADADRPVRATVPTAPPTSRVATFAVVRRRRLRVGNSPILTDGDTPVERERQAPHPLESSRKAPPAAERRSNHDAAIAVSITGLVPLPKLKCPQYGITAELSAAVRRPTLHRRRAARRRTASFGPRSRGDVRSTCHLV